MFSHGFNESQCFASHVGWALHVNKPLTCVHDEFFCNYICDFVITKIKYNKIKREHWFSKNDCEHASFCFYRNFSGFIR